MIGRVAQVAVAAAVLLGIALPAEPAAEPADRRARIDEARRQVLDDAYQAELPS